MSKEIAIVFGNIVYSLSGFLQTTQSPATVCQEAKTSQVPDIQRKRKYLWS
jgi:hypothetical protein